MIFLLSLTVIEANHTTETTRSMYGLFNVPAKLFPFILLVVLQVQSIRLHGFIVIYMILPDYIPPTPLELLDKLFNHDCSASLSMMYRTYVNFSILSPINVIIFFVFDNITNSSLLYQTPLHTLSFHSQIIIPNVSWLGHLSGLIIGLISISDAMHLCLTSDGIEKVFLHKL